LFYGGAATPELANQAAKNIQTQWTNAHGTVTFKGKEYKDVKFVVSAKVVSEKVAKYRAESNAGNTYDPRLNFARIENVNDEVTPNVFDGSSKGGNSFFFRADDIVEGNTSQAHEMGHGFGLIH